MGRDAGAREVQDRGGHGSPGVPAGPPVSPERTGPDPATADGTRAGSLLARTTLTLTISALAIVVTALVALTYFVVDPITERSADDEAALLVLSAQTWVELPPEARPYFELELAQNHDLIVGTGPERARAAPPTDPYLQLIQQKLSERLDAPVTLFEDADLVWVEVPMGGYELPIGFVSNRENIQPLYVGIVIVVLGAAIVFFTALALVRRIARPLVEVAARAQSFRGAENFEPLPEQGPRELASLAHSFNTMAREIATLLSNRTTLLAGVSHDLRTPLARMRIALELLPDNVDPDWIARFERNLEAMDELIGDALRFARGTGESKARVGLRGFLEELTAGFDERIPLVWDSRREGTVELAPGAFKRVFLNLLENARQHADSVRVRVSDEPEGLGIHVIDSGPGIPSQYRERVFQPFFRLESSRSRTTGGSGLGLAIVQQLCHAQGWRVVLTDAQGGGTDMCVVVPAGVPNEPSQSRRTG